MSGRSKRVAFSMKTKLKAPGKAQKTERITHAKFWAPAAVWASRQCGFGGGGDVGTPEGCSVGFPGIAKFRVPFTEPHAGNFGKSTVGDAYTAKTTPKSKKGNICKGPGSACEDQRRAQPARLGRLSTGCPTL